jgi:GTP-binding protein HflX
MQVPLRQIAPTSQGGSHGLTSRAAAPARPATATSITSAAGPRIEGARNTESPRGHLTGANLGTLNVVTGNTTGLKPSQKHALERVYRRRLRPAEVASAELAAYLCQLSREIERQVGILVGRRGEIEHVFVGDASRINLPEIGRIRAGRGRFRGLRLVHTHLRNEPLTRDDLVDLALLRLDLVAAIGVWPDGRPADLHVAHLLPPVEGQQPWRLLPSEPFFRSTLDAAALIAALEEEFDRVAPAAVATDRRDRALLVVVDVRRPSRTPGAPRLAVSDQPGRVAELRELCRTAGVRVMGVMEQRRPDADPKYLIGRGKLEEVLIRAMQLDANVLIFDPDLTPVQAHAIADFTDLKVIDRTMLILDIFAQRAKSRDGKLQVELAQLRYRLPRLHEKNTMMSRLTGGIGGRGPGETKLEENRRRARERIHRLEKEIDRFGQQRAGRRSERTRRGLPIVAIVGYTNAGKSTLLNTLTRSDVLAEDKLFATLDPTTRRLRLPREQDIIIADTVGFIRDLPLDLARAFRATLEELDEADLLLHVVDAADPAHEQQTAAVEAILADLGLGETRRILVMNKVDLVPADERARIGRADGDLPVVAISAQDGATTTPLLEAIEAALYSAGIVTPHLAGDGGAASSPS